MAEKLHSKDEKYAGAAPAIVAAGKAYSWGWIGTAVGATTGAVISFFSSREGGEYTKKVSDFFKNRLEVNISGRLALMGGWAFSSSLIGHYIFMAYGANKGWREAHQGPEQFNRMKEKNDQDEQNLGRLREERNKARDERSEARAETARLKGELEVLTRTAQETTRAAEALRESAEKANSGKEEARSAKSDESEKEDMLSAEGITRADLKKKSIAPRDESYTDAANAEKEAKKEEAELTR